MINTVCFFCDIRGTLTGNKKNNDEDYKKFNDILKKIQKENNTNSIIFSFISNDNSEFVYENKKNLELYMDKSIYFGRQFFETGYLIDDKIYNGKTGKATQILDYLDLLSKKVNIKKVYFADDIEINHKILEFINMKNNDKYNIVSIKPTENIGISELNDLLSQNFQNSNRTTK